MWFILRKWFFTFGAIFTFIDMCKQMALPFAPRTVVKRDGQRVPKGELDNLLDGVGAIYGFICFAGVAAGAGYPATTTGIAGSHQKPC